MKSRFLAVPIAAAIGLALVGVPAAHAATYAQPTCATGIVQAVGQASITLIHDLICPTIIAVVEPEHSVASFTVNLGGHKVSNIRDWGDYNITFTNGTFVGGFSDSFSATTFKGVTFDGYLGGGNDATTVLNSRFIDGAAYSGSQSSADIENSNFINGPATTAQGYSLTAIDGWESYIIARNDTITGYGTAMSVEDSYATLDARYNRITAVHGPGIVIGSPGIHSVVPVSTVTDNILSNNAGDGIDIFDGAGVGRFAVGVTVSDNTTNYNGGDGIRVGDDLTETSATTNGILATISANTAIGNRKFGISSVPSAGIDTVIDGHGNVAKHNGMGQCLNIACQP